MKKTFKLATTTLLLTGVGANIAVPTVALAQTPTTSTQETIEEAIQAATKEESGVRYYKVQWGDTLTVIARALNMELDELVRINNISNPDFILAGTILVFDASNHTLTEIDEAGETSVYSTQTGEEIVQETSSFTPAVALTMPTVERNAVAPVQEVQPVVEEVEVFEVSQQPAEATVQTVIEEIEEFGAKEEPIQEVVQPVVEEVEVEETAEEIQPVIKEETSKIEESSKDEEVIQEEVIQEEVDSKETVEEETVEEIQPVIQEEVSKIEELSKDEEVTEELPSVENEEVEEKLIIEEVTTQEVTFDVEEVDFTQEEAEVEVAVEEVVIEEVATPAPSVNTNNMSAREAFDSLASEKGLSQAEIEGWSYIIERESNWDPQATNPTSGAYGLAQNIDPTRYSSHGDDWATNAHTQLEWMYDYMSDRYGSIQGALDFWNENHWY